MKNKKVLITAAGQGIGLASARAFLDAGAQVIGTDIDISGLQGIENLTALRLDVLSEADIKRVYDSVGPVDVLFNCAGYVHAGNILECEESAWQRSFDLNVTAMYRMIRTFLPGMLVRGGGMAGGIDFSDGGLIKRHGQCVTAGSGAAVQHDAAFSTALTANKVVTSEALMGLTGQTGLTGLIGHRCLPSRSWSWAVIYVADRFIPNGIFGLNDNQWESVEAPSGCFSGLFTQRSVGIILQNIGKLPGRAEQLFIFAGQDAVILRREVQRGVDHGQITTFYMGADHRHRQHTDHRAALKQLEERLHGDGDDGVLRNGHTGTGEGFFHPVTNGRALGIQQPGPVHQLMQGAWPLPADRMFGTGHQTKRLRGQRREIKALLLPLFGIATNGQINHPVLQHLHQLAAGLLHYFNLQQRRALFDLHYRFGQYHGGSGENPSHVQNRA